MRRMKAEGRRQKAEVRSSAFCLLPSAFCLLLLTACTTTNPLATSITNDINVPPFDRAFWSILAEEEDGRVIFAQNADKLTIPASNRKLFAAATVANCLGADARLATTIWRDGEDLVLRGDGDPSLASWRYERDGDFDGVAELLRARGVTRVRDVIADVSLFDRITLPGSWKHGNFDEPYSAPVDALAWNENGEAGKAIREPALRAAQAMSDALVLHGVEVTGGPRVNVEPREWGQYLLEIESPFVAQLLTTVLKNSHNLYAEMLLKRSGGGTYANAFALERAFLTAEAGVGKDAFRFVDGSGLSPEDLVTPQAIVRLLRWMNEPSRRGFWWTVLAQPANEGTLRRRIVTLEHRFRGKTGTINGVAALSGIIAMPDGRYRYVSVIVNHHAGDGDDAAKIIDRIVDRLSQ